MNTIALRFGEQFAPKCGTIAAHQEIIDNKGFVWWGKLGTPVNAKFMKELLDSEDPKILLICSGKAERYWAHAADMTNTRPNSGEYPDYYADKVDSMKTWIKITEFEKAPKDVMSKCVVTSSGSSLSEASKHSMSPYFKITYIENVKKAHRIFSEEEALKRFARLKSRLSTERDQDSLLKGAYYRVEKKEGQRLFNEHKALECLTCIKQTLEKKESISIFTDSKLMFCDFMYYIGYIFENGDVKFDEYCSQIIKGIGKQSIKIKNNLIQLYFGAIFDPEIDKLGIPFNRYTKEDDVDAADIEAFYK